ncbi:MAG: LysR family transcriptional regulator [Alphaproteobacteria bacterium]|nr:LysR family transcriptional regulator [Alphaproteobacteria bacterium]
MRDVDWNLLNSFLAVANMGSLSKAAAQLGSTQPTIGRHIEQLETHLNIRLFDRTQKGYKITELGMQLAEQAKSMKQFADNISLIAAGKSQQVAGTVRITASEMVAVNHLPQAIRHIRNLHPEINFEIVANNRTDNLLEREADIAIRMYQPNQDDLICRKVNDLAMGIYVSQNYPRFDELMALTPTDITKFLSHDFIGYDRDTMIIDGFKQLGIKSNGKDIGKHHFNIRSDSQEVNWHSLKAGLGIGFQVVSLCQTHADLHPVFTNYDLGTMPIWVTAHREVKTSRRIRLVYDQLCDYFSKI